MHSYNMCWQIQILLFILWSSWCWVVQLKPSNSEIVWMSPPMILVSAETIFYFCVSAPALFRHLLSWVSTPCIYYTCIKYLLVVLAGTYNLTMISKYISLFPFGVGCRSSWDIFWAYKETINHQWHYWFQF